MDTRSSPSSAELRNAKPTFEIRAARLMTVMRSPTIAFVTSVILIWFHTSPVSAAEAATPAKEAPWPRAPFVAILSPTNDQVVPFLNPCYVHGTASDPDGVVTQVTYF